MLYRLILKTIGNNLKLKRHQSMKNLTVIVSLFLCIALTNNVLAMGFPHNLLAGKKNLKSEKISNNHGQNISKKVIMLKDSRLNYVGQKLLNYIFRPKN